MMDFGRLANIRGVDFALAEGDPRSERELGGVPRAGRELRLGLPVWTPKEWVGTLYPKGTPTRDFLSRYASQLGTVELNATHYAIPDEATVLRWREAVGPGFRFCPKVPQEISHGLGSRAAEQAIAPFIDAMRGLGDRLGVSFLQLPPTSGPEELPLILRAVDRLAAGLPLAVEFRHPRWFENRRLIAPAFEAFQARGVSMVITDVAGRRDVSHASLTTPTVLVRFVGNQNVDSDHPRARHWAERIASWFQQGLEQAYVFVHQPDNTDAPELTAELARRLARYPSVPELTQLDLTGGEKQISLF